MQLKSLTMIGNICREVKVAKLANKIQKQVGETSMNSSKVAFSKGQEAVYFRFYRKPYDEFRHPINTNTLYVGNGMSLHSQETGLKASKIDIFENGEVNISTCSVPINGDCCNYISKPINRKDFLKDTIAQLKKVTDYLNEHYADGYKRR